MLSHKALVEIRVPASGKKYDVFLPLEIKMSDALKMLASALSELSEGKYMADDDAVLCDAATGNIYNVNREVAELGIHNGSKLLLI